MRDPTDASGVNWFERNSKIVEAASAAMTALVALAALIAVKFQLDANDEVQRSQSAREAFRSHLALAATMPELAAPEDVCTLISGPKSGAYAAFVDHLLYSAEQMLDVEKGWEATFGEALKPHSEYVCTIDPGTAGTVQLENFLVAFKARYCPAENACGK